LISHILSSWWFIVTLGQQRERVANGVVLVNTSAGPIKSAFQRDGSGSWQADLYANLDNR